MYLNATGLLPEPGASEQIIPPDWNRFSGWNACDFALALVAGKAVVARLSSKHAWRRLLQRQRPSGAHAG
jgi:hypothetical protein